MKTLKAVFRLQESRPFIQVNLGYLIRRNAFKFPHREAIVSETGRWTYEAFEWNANKRAQHMTITGGENVYPLDIEEVLFTHPKILEAAVIGLPDAIWGQRIHAVVALLRMGKP